MSEIMKEMGAPRRLTLTPLLYHRIINQRSGYFEDLSKCQSSFRTLPADAETEAAPAEEEDKEAGRAAADEAAARDARAGLGVFAFVDRFKRKARGARTRVFRKYVEARRDEAERLMVSGVVRDYTYDGEVVPLEKQGCLSLYSEAEMRKRLEVEKDARFQKLCRTLWALVALDGVSLRREEYLEMITRFTCVVQADPRNVDENAESDWRNDVGPKQFLIYDEFQAAVWQLVDVWTETSDVDEYVNMLERLILATTMARFDGSLKWRAKEQVTFDTYFAVGGDERARAEALTRRGLGQELTKRFGAAVFIQRHWLTRRDNRAATRIQAHYRRRNVNVLLSPGKTNGLIGKIYAKQIHMLAANERAAGRTEDQALRFDAFCLRYFKGLNGSTDRAMAYLKIFLQSVEALVDERDARGLPLSPRVAVFAELVGIKSDTFNGRLFMEYVLKVLAALYTEKEATELLAGVDGDAAPVPAAKMRQALWQAMPAALRASDAVKARISQAVDKALVAPRFKRLVDPDLAMFTALDLYKAADLWHALRRKRAASVLGLYARGYVARRREARSDHARLSDWGGAIMKDVPVEPKPRRRGSPAAKKRARPASPQVKSKRPGSGGGENDARPTPRDGARKPLAPISRKPSPKSPARSRPTAFDKLCCGITISPRRKIDEALWRDLELNGGTGSLLFDSKLPNKKRPAALLAVLDAQ